MLSSKPRNVDLPRVVDARSVRPRRRGDRRRVVLKVLGVDGAIYPVSLSARAALSYRRVLAGVFEQTGLLLPRLSAAAWDSQLAAFAEEASRQ